MSDLALAEQMLSVPERANAVRKGGTRDRWFRTLTLLTALLVLVLFGGLMTSLIVGAWPAMHAFGFPFVYTEAWNAVTEKFGALAPIYGTLLTAFLAMVFALPIGIGIAIFLTEICPRSLRRPIGIAVELLAGIPSIIYGIWGAFIFAPWFQDHVEAWIVDAFANVPILQDYLGGPPYGIGLFTAALILSIMVLPFISAVTRDVFETVPPVLKEAAYGLGCTTWEVMWRVVLPFSRSGVTGGAMLALGRALGETMAVTFVIGNSHHILKSLFAPGTSISATIANEFSEALGDLYIPALIELGLILFIITTLVLATAQLLLRRLDRLAGGAS
jgi:phosphate transport system permease protein